MGGSRRKDFSSQHGRYRHLDYIWTMDQPRETVWNRMVTLMKRDQPHKTPGPVTSTWTTDFMTREGEGSKTMGDWLRDKTISWKALRRLLQTKAGTFPCEAHLQKWGKYPDGICGLCKRSREMGINLLGAKPAEVPQGTFRVVCADSKPRRQQVLTIIGLFPTGTR